MLTSRLAAVLLLAALAPGQRTWIVNKAGGAGVDFTDIPPAIAAAAPGDTVRVLGNSNVLYSAFTLSKGITIAADNGAGIGGITSSPFVVVMGLPVGQVARIDGLSLSP